MGLFKSLINKHQGKRSSGMFIVDFELVPPVVTVQLLFTWEEIFFWKMLSVLG